MQEPIRYIIEHESSLKDSLIPVLNFLVLLIIAFGGKGYVQRAIAKVNLEEKRRAKLDDKQLDFYSKIYTNLYGLCSNSISNLNLSGFQLQDVVSLKSDNLRLYVERDFLVSLDDFTDYLLDNSTNQIARNFEKEKYFFHNLKNLVLKF